MLMSVEAIERDLGIYPELAGARVLITGLGAACGVDLARAFAEHGCRLVLQIPEPCPETDVLLETLAETAFEIHAYDAPIEDAPTATRFTQRASQVYGALDVVVNLITVAPGELGPAATLQAIEDQISARLQAAVRATQIAANRMGLVWSEGLILNVLRVPEVVSRADAAFAGIARATLSALTRVEAQAVAHQGIRINAVAPPALMWPGGRDVDPQGEPLSSEPDVAALALFLASKRGRSLTGYVFDAEGSSVRY